MFRWIVYVFTRLGWLAWRLSRDFKLQAMWGGIDGWWLFSAWLETFQSHGLSTTFVGWGLEGPRTELKLKGTQRQLFSWKKRFRLVSRTELEKINWLITTCQFYKLLCKAIVMNRLARRLSRFAKESFVFANYIIGNCTHNKRCN